LASLWLRWIRLDDVAADGEPIDDRGAQLPDPRSRGPSSDQLDQRSRTAATTLASWASKASSWPASAALATKACRSQAMPPRHIHLMARVAVMAGNGSPDTRTRSARCQIGRAS